MLARHLAPLLVALALLTTLPSQATAQTSLRPTDDAFAFESYPNWNRNVSELKFGTHYSKQVWTYLKFNVPAGVSRGTLRVCETVAWTGTASVHLVSNDSWSETTLTWNNRPAIGSVIATFPSTVSCHSITVPLNGGQLNSFAITGATKHECHLVSDESSNTSKRPVLLF